MNSNVMPSLVQIEREELKNLVKEVKETVASDINNQPLLTKEKKFSIVDLWNCHNTMKTAFSLRKN